MFNLGLVVLLLIGDLALASNTRCFIPVKNSDLAIDQRDDLRLRCLKKQSSRLSFSQCLKVAQTMEYSFNMEDAQVTCLYEAAGKKKLTFEACQKLANSLAFADTGDEMRWLCLRQAAKKPTRQQCLKLARQMDYPSNTDRAEVFCHDELK